MRRAREIGAGQGVALALALALGSGCAADAQTMTLGLHVQPSVIAFRPDGGRWAELVQLAQSTTSTLYELPHTDGVLAVACLAPDGTFQVEELFATATDLDALLYAQLEPWPSLGCAPPPAQHALVEVSGRMIQGGQIYIGDEEQEGPGPFDFDVETGTRDLVAVGQDTVLIRHDQGFFAPFVEPDIDLSEGAGLSVVSLEGDVAELSSVETDLVTVNGTRVVFDRGMAAAGVTLVPPVALEAGDVELVQATEDGAGFQNVVTAQATGGFLPIVVTVLHNSGGETFSATAISADWSTAGLPTFSDARVEYRTPAGLLAATATAGWLGEHEATSVTFDETVPEFRWPIEPGAAQRFFTIDQRVPNLVMAATVADE